MFTQFPKFHKLTLADKDAYNALIKQWPLLTDLTFTSLMLWWNQLDGLAVSRLNDNLVLCYWLPGDEKNSGLSLIGTNKVDESICMVFDHLHDTDRIKRLVHVPEFVISHMQYPQLFTIKSERDYDEYIIPVSNLTPLDSVMGPRRQRLKRAFSEMDYKNLDVKELDLHDRKNRKLLLQRALNWRSSGIIKDLPKLEDDIVQESMVEGYKLGVRSICLFLGDDLVGFCLYHKPHDIQYAIIVHVKVDHTRPFMLDIIAHTIAKHLAKQGVTYLNFEMDLGIPSCRGFKLILGPTNFFRKYEVQSVSAKNETSWTMKDYF